MRVYKVGRKKLSPKNYVIICEEDGKKQEHMVEMVQLSLAERKVVGFTSGEYPHNEEEWSKVVFWDGVKIIG